MAKFHFRKTLFWDVDISKANVTKQAPFIIGRVLDFGDLKDFQTIKTLYDLETIRSAARRHPFFSPKSINFWSIILNVPLAELSCIRKHSPPLPSAFLMRSEQRD